MKGIGEKMLRREVLLKSYQILKVTSVMNHNEEAHYDAHSGCIKRKLET